MNDLYSGLIRSDLGHNEFYGKYASLNNVDAGGPNFDDLLLQTQLAELRNLEGSSSKKYVATKQFLEQSRQGLSEFADLDTIIGQAVEGRIIQLLNAGLYTSGLNPTGSAVRAGATGEELKKKEAEQADKVLRELTATLKQLNVSDGYSRQFVENLEKQFKNEFTQPWLYKLIKANEAEQLAEDLLNKMPGWSAIQTGNWRDESGKQLIEDIMVFDTQTSFGSSIPISVKIKGEEQGGLTISSIQDLLNLISQMESTSGGKYSITLNNELYEALKQASLIDAQVKSGMHEQEIMTSAKRNAISLEELGFEPSLIYDLYAESDPSGKYFKSNQNSQTLAALANYSLAKAIHLTKISDNQLYLTEKGFTTASEYMEAARQYLKFTNPVKSISDDFMTTQRRYQFYGRDLSKI